MLVSERIFAFQSRSGFSVRRDPVSGTAGNRRGRGFNPGLGFRSVATTTPTTDIPCTSMFQSRSGFSVRRDPHTSLHAVFSCFVSIPVWVFGPSRPDRDNHDRQRLDVSIPVWVFGPSRLQHCGSTGTLLPFQSRSGFSVRRDSPRRVR